MLALSKVGKTIANLIELFCFHLEKLLIFDSGNYTLNTACTFVHETRQNLNLYFAKFVTKL